MKDNDKIEKMMRWRRNELPFHIISTMWNRTARISSSISHTHTHTHLLSFCISPSLHIYLYSIFCHSLYFCLYFFLFYLYMRIYLKLYLVFLWDISRALGKEWCLQASTSPLLPLLPSPKRGGHEWFAWITSPFSIHLSPLPSMCTSTTAVCPESVFPEFPNSRVLLLIQNLHGLVVQLVTVLIVLFRWDVFISTLRNIHQSAGDSLFFFSLTVTGFSDWDSFHPSL